MELYFSIYLEGWKNLNFWIIGHRDKELMLWTWLLKYIILMWYATHYLRLLYICNTFNENLKIEQVIEQSKFSHLYWDSHFSKSERNWDANVKLKPSLRRWVVLWSYNPCFGQFCHQDAIESRDFCALWLNDYE